MVTALLVIAVALVGLALGWLIGRAGGAGGAGGAGRAVVPGGDAVDRVAAGEVVGPESSSIADLLDNHPTGIVVAGPDGTVRFRNAAVTAMSGTHVGVLLDEAIERHIVAARSGDVGGASDEELEMYGPPRAVFVVTARATPDGGAVVFVDDISERRRIERVRTDFVANISHELKTPVGAMSVLAEALVGETDPDTIARMVHRIVSEADRASNTLDDLMELSMIESGGRIGVDAVSVDDVIADSIARVAELAAQRQIEIVRGSEPGDAGAVSAMIQGDRRQLVSAVGNLLENAVKYSEQGGHVRIDVGAHPEAVEIAVIDHGVGIPQRDLDRVFERFYRVDQARSRATGGTGLGLSIVRHVATRHGGAVAVASTEGEGSTFTLRLPVSGAGQPSSGSGGVLEGTT